jgi:hypothetical protein
VEPADAPVSIEPVGAHARRLFREHDLYLRRTYPKQKYLHWPVLREGLGVGRLLFGLVLLGRPVRRRFGIPLFRQIGDMVRLMRQGVDANCYYFFELYRPGGLARAAQYLTRFETKNGLLRALNWKLRPRENDDNPGDKYLLSQRCRENGLSAVPVLLLADGERLDWNGHGPEHLRRDLFLKFRRGKGARGTETVHWTGAAHRLGDGRLVNEAGLLDHIQAKAKERNRDLMVLPRLVNHPAIADLADRSVMAMRVITCRDAQDRPEVALAFLRVLGRLESSWAVHPELGAPIDLESGRLGPFTAELFQWRFFDTFAVHPINGVAVEGRILPFWRETKELVLAAHRLFPAFVLFGWDVAITPEGPMILEGNVVPDVNFLQRVFHHGAGETRLGPLLSHQLLLLERGKDTHARPVDRG